MRLETIQTFDQLGVQTKRQKRQKRQKDKKTKRQKRQKGKKTKIQKDKRQTPKREFNILTSGQFRTLAMFLTLPACWQCA